MAMLNLLDRVRVSGRMILAGVLLCLSTTGYGAVIPLHQPVATAGVFATGGPENRATLVQVLNPVTITALGAEIDPEGRSEYAWRIYNAASDTGAGAALPNPVDLGAPLFEDTGIFFDDLGLQVYDHSVSVALGIGFYVIEFFIRDPGTLMRSYPESGQSLPFVTNDGNFRVINGLSHPSTAGRVVDNSLLPAFSVTTASSRIPGPAPALLLAAGLLAGGSRLRRGPGPQAR